MKTLRRLVILAVLVALGYGALSLWQSPLFALYEIKKGLDEHDAVRVERYVDLEKMVAAGSDVVGALAKEKIGVNGGDLGSQILGAIVGAVANKAGEAAAIEGAMEVRRAIQRGDMKPAVGPFVVDDGFAAFGGMQSFSQSAIVDLNGHCNGHEAVLRAVFEERDGATLGWPKRWVLVGIDKGSLPARARACRA